MSKIKFSPSIALEVFCLIEAFYRGREKRDEERKKIIDGFAAQLPDDFGNGGKVSASLMAVLLSAYIEKPLGDVSLDELIELFSSPEQIVEKVRNIKISGVFSEYMNQLLDNLCCGVAASQVKMLTELKKIGFETQYAEKVLPIVQRYIDKCQAETERFDFDRLFSDLAILKNCDLSEDVTIIASYFSFPTSFYLNGARYLSCVYFGKADMDLFSLTAHECMHGFADDELLTLYQEYMTFDAYLVETHRRLFEEYTSGDEEEFVMAAENYLCLRSGNYQREKLMNFAKTRYGGSCPVSAILFDFLSRESDIPRDYNAWLKALFRSDRLPRKNVREYVETLR